MNNQVIKDAHFLNPVNRNSKNALNSISRLALTFGKLFKTSLPMVFDLKSDSLEEHKLCGIIKNEFTRYRTEIISEEFYIQHAPKNASKSCNQSSYWQEANELVIGNKELDGEEEGETKHIPADEYWNKVHRLFLFYSLKSI